MIEIWINRLDWRGNVVTWDPSDRVQPLLHLLPPKTVYNPFPAEVAKRWIFLKYVSAHFHREANESIHTLDF